ncbi:MAG TPA: hypothetical protein V6D07_12190 [Trichocoleus sp.]
MLFYFTPATLVVAIALQTLMQSGASSKPDGETWMFILLAAVLWPVTLPSILWKKYTDMTASTLFFSASNQGITLM